MKKVLFILPTEDRGASSRYRVYQYLKHIDDEFEYDIKPFMTNEMYVNWKSGNAKKIIVPFFKSFFNRIGQILIIKKYDVVFIHRDAIPFGPMIFERIIKNKKKKIILDIDDAIFCNDIEDISNKRNKILYQLKYGKRFNTSIKVADYIYCGNSYIMEYCNKYNDNTIYMPTVIDTENISVDDKIEFVKKYFTIAWIGNPGNSKYLEGILEYINESAQRNNTKICLLLIGSRKLKEDLYQNIEFKYYEWNENTEYSLLKKADIGIMPLKDSNWAKGKCALKLLQYMAIGLPVIASDVGENKNVVKEGKNGFLVKEEEDWIKYIDFYIKNQEKISEMEEFCKEYVKHNYSVNVWRNEWIKKILD